MSFRMAPSGSATTGFSAIGTVLKTWPVAENCWPCPPRFPSRRRTIANAADNLARRIRYDAPNARPGKCFEWPSFSPSPARSKYRIAHEQHGLFPWLFDFALRVETVHDTCVFNSRSLPDNLSFHPKLGLHSRSQALSSCQKERISPSSNPATVQSTLCPRSKSAPVAFQNT